MLELYHSNWSICAQKVRLVVAEKGLDVVEHHVDLRAREQQTPEYLKLNPKGYVPTLVHDGRPVIESAIICEYLDEVFPDPPLSPADPADRAYMRTWTRRPDDGLHRACATVTNAIAFRLQWLEKPAEEIEAMLAATPDPARRTWRREMIEKGVSSQLFVNAVWVYEALLSDMEKALQDRDWLGGDAYTLADVSLTSYLIRVAELQFHPMWENRRPAVTDWFARIRARDNYKKAFDNHPYDAYAAQMAEQGTLQWPRVAEILAA
ncbi:MAG: glutathione S-transferase family protein [Alphaproteobacteria bacterium]